uniref:DUF1330 domain-containing protein n=1 Tax=Paractinoplanes polyasparticus TaxID=2856853 RepID=UPI001C85C3A5|nr:DUF1330 domain-containing protein [Actinoplanes polyasparticus]
MAVDPDGDFLTAFLADGAEEPVVMLNLLRFADGGRPLYQQYMRAFSEKIGPRYGIEVVYAGEGASALIAEPGQQWDAVLLVRYPSRQVFAQMIDDPEYQSITHLRTKALSEAVLQPTDPLGHRA